MGVYGELTARIVKDTGCRLLEATELENHESPCASSNVWVWLYSETMSFIRDGSWEDVLVSLMSPLGVL